MERRSGMTMRLLYTESAASGAASSRAIPKRMENHQRDVLRLYRALLREGRKKGCEQHVKQEFFRRKATFDPKDLRMADTRYRIGLLELEKLRKAEHVTFAKSAQ